MVAIIIFYLKNICRAYVETLFGHQDKISGIDCGARERCITVGGRDGSARLWKILEESQLVYNGPQSSLDCVKLLNEEHWVTAGEDGHLAVWGLHKKKPLALVSGHFKVSAILIQLYVLTSITHLS